MIEDVNGRFNLNVQNIDKKQPRRTQIAAQIVQRQQFREREDVGNWRDALSLAESVDHPDRTRLIKIYKDIDLDGHISGIISSIKNKIKSKPFIIVNSNGDTDDEKTEQFEKEWFFKFIDFIIEAPFWGYSLVQLGSIVDDGFPNIEIIPREYVVPERSLVKKDLHEGRNRNGENAFFYKEDPLKDWFIFIGENNDMGLFNKAAPHALSKKNLFAEMWEYGELFGMPIRLGKTDINDTQRRQQMERMFTHQGSAEWLVVDKDDDVTFVDRGTIADAVDVFIEPIKLSNEEISKAFAGQVATFDEKSFVGSAEVQERIFNDWIITKMRNARFVINNQLIPRMVFHRMLPTGFSFKWKAEETLSVIDRTKQIKDLTNAGYTFTADTVSEEVGIEVEGVKVEEGSVNTVMNDVQKLYAKFLGDVK